MHAGVVVCAYTPDRWPLLERAIESIDAQETDADVVIVIDHHDEMLETARSTWPMHTVIPNRYERGLSGARNTGVEALATDVVAFLDDDACGHPRWLSELIAPFDDDRVGLTGGRVEPEWTAGRPKWFPEEFLWVVGCSYRGLPTDAARIRNPIGASMAVRRQVFTDVGLFVNGIGRIGKLPLGCEETELAIRAATEGYETRYVPSSVVSHFVSSDRHEFDYFVRRCRAEGRSKAAVTALAGADAALDTERSYVTKTLPSGIVRSLRRVVVGPRAGALGTAGAIVAGGLITAASYGRAIVRAQFDARRTAPTA